MIVRIQANGGSFRGAGLYYLHDKSADATLEKHLKPKTDERVWFSDTRNCLSIDPGRALEGGRHTLEQAGRRRPKPAGTPEWAASLKRLKARAQPGALPLADNLASPA